MRSQVHASTAPLGVFLPLLLLAALFVIMNVDHANGCSDASWQLFKGYFQKQYTTLDEETHRHNIFCDNLQIIHSHNERYELGEVTFEMGVNQFADLTREEFRRWLHGDSVSSSSSGRGRGNNVVGVLTTITNKY